MFADAKQWKSSRLILACIDVYNKVKSTMDTMYKRKQGGATWQMAHALVSFPLQSGHVAKSRDK